MFTKYYILAYNHRIVRESFNKKALEEIYHVMFHEERQDIDFVYKEFKTLNEYKKFYGMPKDIFNVGITFNLFELEYTQALELKETLMQIGQSKKAKEIELFIKMNLGFEAMYDFDIAATGNKIKKGDVFISSTGTISGTVDGVPFIDRSRFRPVFMTTEKVEKCVNFEEE